TAIAGVIHDRAPAGKIYPSYLGYMQDARTDSGKPVALVAARQGTGRDETAITSTQAGLPVLDGVSLSIAEGEKVALVGASGGGKSTLVDLIPRFYDPIKGSILIDGEDIRNYTLDSLRSKMGIVTQETFLFNSSIKDNIAYGLDNYPDDKIIEAAKAANAHEFIIQTNDGYDTIIGERGIKLSGGQRQRLTIARAILKNPDIMIFDEATSALDSESEILVQEAIERMMKNRTTVVIAHRLSTIRNATRIIVIERGKIIQTGTHQELMLRENGLYKKLYEMQFRDDD
ncbi:MAG: ATP-binding cassette domain-containing protein, partial [Psychromonas sp.]|nr:ATP-binding cassette domain-containing protein [Psychromonas sp.]